MNFIRSSKDFVIEKLFSLQNYKRVFELDALRGLIMVFMALDHANMFLGKPVKTGMEVWMGEFAEYHGDLLAFFTRFITHLSAPGFFFLMGIGIVLFAISRKEKGWSKTRTYLYFLQRGALLILLQLLIVNPAWKIYSPEFPFYFGVLYCLGGSMIVGILFLEIPGLILAGISLVFIILTEILLPDVTQYVFHPPYLRLILLPGFTPPNLLVLYPIFPWLGVMGLGMAYARYLKKEMPNRHRTTMIIGFIMIGCFFIVRLIGGFGNIRMATGDGLISFFNVVKYPPSIALILISLGINMVLLGIFGTIMSKGKNLLKPLIILGSTPLFFYMAHLYLYGLMSVLFGHAKMAIPKMYIFWIAGLIIMLPLCALFAMLKQRSSIKNPIRLI